MTAVKLGAPFEFIRRIQTQVTSGSSRGSNKRAEKGTWMTAIKIRWPRGVIGEEANSHQLVSKILSIKTSRQN